MSVSRTAKRKPKPPPLTVEELAEAVGISGRTLHRHFRAGCPRGSVEAVRQWRAENIGIDPAEAVVADNGSSITYFRRVRPDLHTALPLAAAALGGSVCGALLASRIPAAAFDPIILLVLVGVGAYTLLKPDLGSISALRFSGRRHLSVAALVGFAIGVYDGILGPGTGSFLVFALVGLLGYGFLQASAQAKIANFATNLGALLVFIPQGAVMWQIGLLMGVCNVAGGYLGARTAVAKGSGFVRVVFVLVVGAFIVKIGYDTVAGLG